MCLGHHSQPQDQIRQIDHPSASESESPCASRVKNEPTSPPTSQPPMYQHRISTKKKQRTGSRRRKRRTSGKRPTVPVRRNKLRPRRERGREEPTERSYMAEE